MRKPSMTQYNIEFPSDAAVQERLNHLLAKNKVDPESMVTTRVDSKTLVQFLAPKSDTLREDLKRLKVTVREDLIFRFVMPNHHGELHRLAKSLADGDINIISLYGNVEGDHMKIVLAVDHPADARALIEKLGFDQRHSICD